MLDQNDLKKVQNMLRQTKEEILVEVDEKIKLLPTKDEFFSKMDELMGEIKASREEQTLQAGSISEHSDQLEDHEQRIEKLESTVTPATSG